MAFTCARTGQVTPLLPKGWDKSSTSKPISLDTHSSSDNSSHVNDSHLRDNIIQSIRLSTPNKTAHRPTYHSKHQSPISFRGFEQSSPLRSPSDPEINLGANVPASRQQPTVASNATRGAGPQMTRHARRQLGSGLSSGIGDSHGWNVAPLQTRSSNLSIPSPVDVSRSRVLLRDTLCEQTTQWHDLVHDSSCSEQLVGVHARCCQVLTRRNGKQCPPG